MSGPAGGCVDGVGDVVLGDDPPVEDPEPVDGVVGVVVVGVSAVSASPVTATVVRSFSFCSSPTLSGRAIGLG